MCAKRTVNHVHDSRKPERHIAFAIIVVVAAISLFVAMIDFSPYQTPFIATTTYSGVQDENIFGKAGANIVFFLLRYLGWSAWLIPAILLLFANMLVSPLDRPMTKGRMSAIVIMVISCAALLEYIQDAWMSAETFLSVSKNILSAGLGGLIGYWLCCCIFEKIFALTGSAIILGTAFILSSVYVFTRCISLNGALEKKIQQYGYCRVVLLGCIKYIIAWMRYLIVELWRMLVNCIRKLWHKVPEQPLQQQPKKQEIVHVPENVIPEKIVPAQQFVVNDSVEQPKRDVKVSLPVAKGKYVLPPIDLLQRSKAVASADDHAEVSRQLVNTLSEFGVSVQAGEVFVGPVITRYEISPAPGVRVEKIVNLDKNIALNLRAQSVRILAPVPGRGCVGIELPNKSPQMVCLREILESSDWANMKADIPVVLGRGTTGEPMINDLARMPHLLIAGSTGSGKTVCINAIIASLVYCSTPDDLRFIMVDPKIVEMQVFNRLPHMLIPVVTDPKKVPNALKWLISEMENRYKIFAKAGVRNIAGFNAKILKDAEEKQRAEELEKELSPEERTAVNNMMPSEADTIDVPRKKIPYIVCVIDELADLMMVAPADIETSVARLAQLARAAGIHLILATQRPSVNVITGIIKANLPSRIAFKVASKVDSRTILDAGGAEGLLGRGDMLFQPPGASGLLRAQGALVSDEEINAIVDFLYEKNGEPNYAMDVHEMVENGDDEEGGFSDEDWDDDMIPRALEVIRSSDRASTSLLQRRLRIGYNRAARIMDTLVEKGLVNKDVMPSNTDNL